MADLSVKGIDDELMIELKVEAAKEHRKMRELVVDAITDYIKNPAGRGLVRGKRVKG